MLYLETVTKVTSVIEGFLKDDGFDFNIVCENLSIIYDVGDAVATSTNSLPAESYQPFMMSILQLASKLEELAEKTWKEAECLNHLRLESLEYSELIRTVFFLSRLMLDSMTCPTVQSVEDFQDACRKKCLISCANNLKNLVNSESSSSSESINTVESLLSLLFFIHTYSLGMQWNDSLEETRIFTADIAKFLKTIECFGEESWRSEVELLVQQTQDNNVHLNNSQKADILKEKLRNMYPNYQLYVIVFNDCDVGFNFAYCGKKDQLICSMHRGLCNIIVYRSQKWSKATENCREQLVREVKACPIGGFAHWSNYGGYPGVLRNNHIRNSGFVTLIRKNQNAEVRAVNSGPGHWMEVVSKAGREFVLVVGYN